MYVCAAAVILVFFLIQSNNIFFHCYECIVLIYGIVIRRLIGDDNEDRELG